MTEAESWESYDKLLVGRKSFASYRSFLLH